MSYTPDMRRLSLAVLLLAPLTLTGCEFLDRIFGKADDAIQTARGKQRPFPSSAQADVRNQGPVSGRQLNRAASQAMAAADVSGVQDGRVIFDGEAPVRDAVASPFNLGGGQPPAVSADRALDYGPRPSVPYTPGQPRTSDLRTGEPPSPDLTLPPGGPADGTARGAGPTLAQYDAFQRMPGLFRNIYDVVSRAGWGAQAPRRTPTRHTPSRVTVHHTDGNQTIDMQTSINAVKAIQNDHRNVSSRRKHGHWDDIGYHFLIDGAGRIFEGRHAENIGAHAGSGNNTGNVGIALMGNFDRQQLTAPQREALVRLVTFLSIRYRRDPSAAGFIEPHQHYAEEDGGGTDCPGANVLAFLRSGELMRAAGVEIARLGQDARFRPAAVIPAA